MWRELYIARFSLPAIPPPATVTWRSQYQQQQELEAAADSHYMMDCMPAPFVDLMPLRRDEDFLD